MRHLKRGRKFGRERDQRRALLRSMAASLFRQGRIRTTEAKAKALRPYAEKLVTRAKHPSLANRRLLLSSFSPAVVDEIIARAEALRKQPGGYTRIMRIGERRSDRAAMALIEFI